MPPKTAWAASGCGRSSRKPVSLSLLQRIVLRDGAAEFFARLSPEEQADLPFNWRAWGRPEQFAPDGAWRFWMAQAGRGFGKTRLGAEWVREKVRALPGTHGALVAPTPGQAREVMITGPSGILACSPEKERPHYEPTKRLLTWPLVPGTGQPTTAGIYSAFNFEELRGPQYHWGWLDELGKWKYPTEAFDQMNFGLRLGNHPQACITTTPRNIAVIRKLLKDKRCVVTRGSTFDNANNLAEDYLADMQDKYGGSRLGRQELEGELLDDVPGALWKRGPMIDKYRVKDPPYCRTTGTGVILADKLGRPVPDLDEIVVGVDPSVADNADVENEDGQGTDQCGICVAGRKGSGINARYYVLEDATIFGSPDAWADVVVRCYERWKANRVVAEVNNGGALVEAVIRQKSQRLKYEGVHASRGKRTRAEPVSVLYEQGRVHHVGSFEELEDQMCTFTPSSSKSPDRLDALVWAITDLSESSGAGDRLKRLVANV